MRNRHALAPLARGDLQAPERNQANAGLSSPNLVSMAGWTNRGYQRSVILNDRDPGVVCMRAVRILTAVAATVATGAVLVTPASAARPAAAGAFVGGPYVTQTVAGQCAIGIDYSWQNASGIERATVQFQMRTPDGTEWTDAGQPSTYDPEHWRVPRTYSYTAGLYVDITGTPHFFRAIGQTYNHKNLVIEGTSAVSTTSPAWNCG